VGPGVPSPTRVGIVVGTVGSVVGTAVGVGVGVAGVWGLWMHPAAMSNPTVHTRVKIRSTRFILDDRVKWRDKSIGVSYEGRSVSVARR